MDVQVEGVSLAQRPTSKIRPKPLSTVWDTLSDADFPARLLSAPSNIETISLWGARYPGQKLYAKLPDVMSLTEEPVPPPTFEPDNDDIWDLIASLCDALRGLIDAFPQYHPPNTPDTHPHGPISAVQLLKTGEAFIESLEPLRPLRARKLTDRALRSTPELMAHVCELEHRFDDLERVLSLAPVVFGELNHEDCQTVIAKVETIMVVLGVGHDEG